MAVRLMDGLPGGRHVERDKYGTEAPRYQWLFYGPCCGEFGHELLGVGLLRAMAREYGRVTVCTRPGRQPLYHGITRDIIAHDIVVEGMCHHARHDTPVTLMKQKQWTPDSATVIRQFDVYSGSGQRRLREGEFRRYGRALKEFAGAIVVHARNRPHVPARNWPVENWHEIAEWLFDEGHAARIVCVGTPDHALTIAGAYDARGLGLAQQMNILASAKLAVGPSSGPMHLAQHCGCPIVAWCGGAPVEYRDTIRRYTSAWNPFGTPANAFACGSWRPSMEQVKAEMLEMLT